ncbi:MAG: hypothetical protein NVSMB48_00170 [Marmoricola sp.]
MLRRRVRALIVSGAVAVGVLGAVSTGPAHAVPAATPTMTITGQATYQCQATANGQAPQTHTFSAQLKLTVPTVLHPGEQLALSGTFALQFPEETRQIASAMGVDHGEATSNDLSTTINVPGSGTRLVAYRWDSGNQPITDPMVISGPIAFHPITIPNNASGTFQIQMPQNGFVPNPISKNPARVAFTAQSVATGAVATVNINSGCYMPSPNPAVFGRIPIRASNSTSGGSTAAGPAASAGTGGASSSAPAGTTVTGTSASSPTGGGSSTQQSAVPSSMGGGLTTASQLQAANSAGTPTYVVAPSGQDGIFVKTNLLIMLVFFVLVVCAAYGALTTVRLRSLRKALEDQ